MTDVTDPVCVTALCKWAESTEPTEAALGAGVEDHRKFYFGQTNDKEYVNEYGRSVVTYADNLAEWADAAWVGSVGPFWPESVTWKWIAPDGVSVADLRDSERDLLEENRVNFMTAEYKHEYMKNGICGDGNFIDNVLGADYITHQIRENLYEIFIANKKIAYTDDGFALVAAGVFAALVALLAEGVDRNVWGCTGGIRDYKSPSSRRAWIEISFCLSPPIAALGRPPRGGRG